MVRLAINTSGIFAVIAGVPFCFAYFVNKGVFIGIDHHASVSEMVKIAD